MYLGQGEVNSPVRTNFLSIFSVNLDVNLSVVHFHINLRKKRTKNLSGPLSYFPLDLGLYSTTDILYKTAEFSSQNFLRGKFLFFFV